jgi:hypothetical protein
MIVAIQFTDNDGRMTICAQVFRHCRSPKFEIYIIARVIRNGQVFEIRTTKMAIMPFAVDPKPAAYLQDDLELD